MEVSEKPLDYKEYALLYIDDEPENLEAFEDEFEDYFKIFTASSGVEGLRVLEEKSISLVLVDQRMPEMSGVEVLEEVRRKKPDILRIMITAHTDLDVVIEAINKGNVYQYFKKPWEHEELRTGVMRGIEHYHDKRVQEQLQAERLENMKKMVRSNRLAAVGTMVSGLVHEIRNPMVAIQTFLQLVPRKMGDKAFMERYVQIAHDEADRIEKILENLLSFARPIQPVLRPCDLNEIVDRILQLLFLQARRKNIRVDFDKEIPLPQVQGDPNQIVQVIQNLGMNAIQAMDREGTLFFRTYTVEQPGGGSFVGLEVTDTGKGIAREDVEKIFDPFYTTKEEGTGLGLSISYQIVNEHNGILEAKSEPGKGTSFFLSLPKFDPRQQGEEPLLMGKRTLTGTDV